ncbi:MAG: hypothetical protein LBC69_01780 [Eubacteriaceae bacterium]|jgi:hypothetical protein|nr:hypothetical protein [Eubacteriaceae bacterium]
MTRHHAKKIAALAAALACASLASCDSFDREEKDFPDLTYKRPGSWKSIGEQDRYTYYSNDNELKATVTVNRYLENENLDAFMETAIAQPDGLYITSPQILKSETTSVSEKTAREYLITGLVNDTKVEYRIVGFIANDHGYTFSFSQAGSFSQENSRIVDRVIKSIQITESS